MDALRRIVRMAAVSVLRVYRNPINWLWIVVLPLFFGVGLARMFSGGEGPPRVYIVDGDQGPSSAVFIEAMKETPYTVVLLPRDQAIERIESGKIGLAIVLPEDFSESVASGHPRLELWRAPSSIPGNEERRAHAVAAGMAAGRLTHEVPLERKAPSDRADSTDYPYKKMVFGFYAMFALSGLILRAVSIHEERQSGTLQRALVMGVPYGEIVAAHVLALALVGVVQALVIIGVTGALGANWLAGGPFAIVAPVICTILASAGLGLGVAGLVRTATQFRAFAQIIGVTLGMLGGGFWPLEVVPAAVRQVGSLSPVYWSIEALRSGFAYGGDATALAVPCAILLVFGVLGTAAGVAGLNRYAS